MILVCSESKPFNNHLSKIFGDRLVIRSGLIEPDLKQGKIQLIHVSSYADRLKDWIEAYGKSSPVSFAVASDSPDIAEMLNYAHIGAKAYCNSYMADAYYLQLERLLENGQTWYPPVLMTQALDVARKSLNRTNAFSALNSLTAREKEITFAVADGKSNKLVAQQFGISERTVKAHLTNIFEKLEVKDRVALVIYLNQFNFRREDRPTVA